MHLNSYIAVCRQRTTETPEQVTARAVSILQDRYAAEIDAGLIDIDSVYVDGRHRYPRVWVTVSQEIAEAWSASQGWSRIGVIPEPEEPEPVTPEEPEE